MLRLGVLDQSPVPAGSGPADALAATCDLARLADRAGYHRYWVAEHHNSEGLAGSAPEVLVGAVAATTDRIRVGSGGVMLTHYSPLKVAEVFGVLACLYPGRIDLGVGRAPGSDPDTLVALAPTGTPTSLETYPARVRELVAWLEGATSDRGVAARPTAEPPPEVWLLASSIDSASIAAHLGLPLAWADFITTGDGAPIVRAYLDQYRPSPGRPEPRALVAVGVICADSDAEAHRLASSVYRWRAGGLRGPVPPPDPAPGDRPSDDTPAPGPGTGVTRVGPRRRPLVVGSPATCRDRLSAIADAHGVDELMVVTIVFDHEARRRSYELLAEAFAL
ncbi:MAG: LLM class flavin-dependent oxidoreductase [Actinomyces sp.]|nr:MAG: LLM class flavin-dependent oxidoreductase [Actinomyces sp.]